MYSFIPLCISAGLFLPLPTEYKGVLAKLSEGYDAG